VTFSASIACLLAEFACLLAEFACRFV